MSRYLVQIPQPNRALVLDLWELIEADDMGHAAAKVAARWGPGRREAFVADEHGPLHPTGQPMAVHGFTLDVKDRGMSVQAQGRT